MNNILKIFLLLLIGTSFVACKQYSIKKEYKKWIPYKEGETYIFISDKGNIDTLKILKLERFNNPEDHLSIISPYHEKIIVDAYVPDLWTNPMGTTFQKSIQSILVMDANTSNTTIDIIFKPYDYYFESKNNDLDKIVYFSSEIGGKEYDDLTIFKSNHSLNFIERPLNEIIWSKEFGIVEYNLDGEKFKLKERF